MTKRTAIQQFSADERKNKAAELYLQGYSQFNMSKLLGISQTTLSKDLAVVREEWLAERVADYDHKMLRELTALDLQESCLWEAWYNSCKQEIISTITQKKILQKPPSKSKKKRKDEDEDDIEATGLIIVEENVKTVTKNMIGDPRFMAEITKVRELRCKLTGLLEDKPLETPIINIWQQLQEIDFARDKDEVEDRLRAIESRPLSVMDKSGISDFTNTEPTGLDSPTNE